MKKLIDSLSSPENFLKLLYSKKHKIFKMLDPKTKNNLLHVVLEKDVKTIDSIFSDSKNRFTSVVTKEMVNHINELGHAPIHLAIQKGHLAATVFLLEMKANPNVTLKTETSPLMMAAECGHFKLVEVLLSRKADPYITDNKGYIPLHRAASFNHLLVLNSLLLNAPQTINRPDRDGFTALHYAATADENGTIIKFLIEKKAEVNKFSGDIGQTPFMVAAHYNKIAAARILLNSNAEPCILNKIGYSATTVAIEHGSIEFLKFLLDSRIIAKDFISSLAQKELLPVQTAASSNQIEMLKFLLTTNPGMINLTDGFGQTGLHSYFALENPEMTHLLLENKADPNIRNFKGVTLLMTACAFGREKIVNLIMTSSKIKYDLSISDHEDRTAFYWAACSGKVPIGKCLLKAGDVSAGKFVLKDQCDSKAKEKENSTKSDNFKLDKKMENSVKSIEQGPFFKFKHGDTPFHVAVVNNYVDFVRFLESKAVSPDLPDKVGCTALVYSLYEGYDAMALALIENKADINYAGGDNISPLHVAIYRKRITLLSTILNEKNIEINICSKLAGTPLCLAAQTGNEEAVRLLIDRKADLNLSNNETTPLCASRQKEGRDRIVKLLLDAKADHTTRGSKKFIPLLVVLNNIFFPNLGGHGQNHWETLRYLIQLSPDAPLNPACNTALHLAVNFNKPGFVKIYWNALSM